MPVAAGQGLGPYEVQALVGERMGEVYRPRGRRLHCRGSGWTTRGDRPEKPTCVAEGAGRRS